MDIAKKVEGSTLTVTVTGQLDTVTAPQLESELSLDEVEELVFDLSGVAYISSAGLRVLLSAYKTMAKKRGMKIIGSQPAVLEVFKITGLASIFKLT